MDRRFEGTVARAYNLIWAILGLQNICCRTSICFRKKPTESNAQAENQTVLDLSWVSATKGQVLRFHVVAEEFNVPEGQKCAGRQQVQNSSGRQGSWVVDF